MGKHLSKYSSEAYYNNNKDNLAKPYVSFIVKPTKQMIYIPKPKLITFYVDNINIYTTEYAEYQAKEGMTWGEWINSEYNTDNFRKSGNIVYGYTDYPIYYSSGGNNIQVSDIIIENHTYHKAVSGGSDD